MERPAPAVDQDFLHAVIRCGHGDSAHLIAYLRSDRPVESGERILLAELLAGDWRQPPGRPSIKANERAEYRQLIEEAKTHRAILVSQGIASSEAEVQAAERAALDPRARSIFAESSKGAARSVESIQRHMQSKKERILEIKLPGPTLKR